MRIWSIHPQYLDAQGLVALWREALLARAVLQGATRGYKHHPQLQRFQAQDDPLASIEAYLFEVYQQACARGYKFDASKVRQPAQAPAQIPVTTGQMQYEWQHLLYKLQQRSRDVWQRWQGLAEPRPHPLFVVHAGAVADWERV